MRVLFDLIGAQTASRTRGIGRYTHALALEMRRRRGADELAFAVSANFPETEDALRAEFGAASFTRYATPETGGYSTPSSDPKRRLGEAVYRRAVAAAAPDVLLSSSLFEAWPRDFAVPTFDRLSPRLCAAVVYDFIPTLFSDLYLRDRRARQFQEEQMKATASADLMLAISECTRADAIRLLGVAPERIVNISAAADAAFQPVAPSASDADRLGRLGLRGPFVFCASGDDPRKNVGAAVEAWSLMDARARAGRQLALLVPFTDARKHEIAARAAAGGIDAEIVFLDRLSDEDLAFLYARCDLFLFPSLYEGFGLPALEAMQCGAPVLVGDNSSLREIVDRPDLRCDTQAPQEVAQALARLLADGAARAEAAAWGLKRARAFSWRASADRAWEAIREAEARTTPSRARPLPGSLLLAEGFEAEAAEIMRSAPTGEQRPDAVADAIVTSCPQLYDGARRRLLIDVTTIVAKDDRTGIQRVVRNIATALYRENGLDVTPVAIRLEGDRLISCERYIARETGVAQTVPDAEVEIAPGDCLLMLDNSWKDYERFRAVFARMRAAGGQVVSCIYDLIPQLWRGASVGRVPEIHLAWLETALVESDGMIAISRTVAEELCAFVAAHALPTRPGLRIGWFHCGSDIAPARDGEAKAAVREAFASSAPTFLLVATVEPRKGHAIALAAFEHLWNAGVDARLVLIGRRGWHVETIIAAMERHPERGRRLFWFENADDVDLAFAYDHCAAVLAPSYAEGFGLPLAEAAWKGKPVICSDIPVFREIGGEGALYFRVNDSAALAATVRDFLAGRAKPDPSRVVRPTWREAALRIVEVVMRGDWMRALP